MLYPVPQTDSVTEGAMAALVARLRLTSPKPEALAAVPDATVALHLARWTGTLSSALGDTVTRPLLYWGAELDGACIMLAAGSLYAARGFSRQAGADNSIPDAADAAAQYLARLRPSADGKGKSENPEYVDSGGNVPQDAPVITSASTADSYIDRRACGAGGYP